MGTSAMLYIYEGGKCRLASITGCDGYPDGLGLELLGFACNKRNLRTLAKVLPNCSFLTEAEIRMMKGFSTQQMSAYIETHRGYAYEFGTWILDRIIRDGGRVSMRFWSGDMRGEDWAYVIDLDKGSFEVYKGWNKKPVPEGERFYDGSDVGLYGLYPFREVAVFDLDDLPSNHEFVEACEVYREW